MNTEVKRLLERAVDVYTLPVIVLEAHRLMADSRTSAQNIADLLAHDPALAGRILKLANSPYYGFRRRIANMTQAIVVLGFQAVRNLMLTASVIDAFTQESNDFDAGRFWADAVATAVTAAKLAQLTEAPNSEEAYVAGLLHDIGRLIVVQHLPDVHSTVVQKQRDGMSREEAELSTLGVRSAVIGSRLVSSWGLPKSLSHAIRDQQSLTDPAERSQLADVLHLATIMVQTLVPDPERVPMLPTAVEGLSQRLGYDIDQLGSWVGEVVVVVREAKEFFEILGLGRLDLLPQ